MKFVTLLLLAALALAATGARAQITPTQAECAAAKAARKATCREFTVPAGKETCVEYEFAPKTPRKMTTGATMPRTTDPMRKLGRSAGAQCRAIAAADTAGKLLTWGSGRESKQGTKTTCVASYTGATANANAWSKVTCCAEKTALDKACWKAYGAAAKAAKTAAAVPKPKP